jgi:hypothetical protein
LKKDLIARARVLRYEEEGKDKSGIRPLDVVATVLLVAFLFVVVADVAYHVMWDMPQADLIPHWEHIQIWSAYASYDSAMNTTGGWVVTINFQNTCCVDVTITNLLINGKPWNDSSYSDATGRYVCNISPSTLTRIILYAFNTQLNISKDCQCPVEHQQGLSLPPGTSATITFDIVKGLGFTSGVSVEIKLHSAIGYDYPTMITLS